MNNWPKDNDAALDAFYGRPDGSAKWEVGNLVYISAPWRCYLAGTKTEMLRGIRVHKKVSESLKAIFKEIWEYCGKSQETIEKYDLHQIGGAYYFRARRGSSRLSNHARGIAIDLDPLSNVMRRGNRGDMAAFVILAFQRHGWRWGGEFSDPMHFEAVWSATSNAVAKAWEVNPVVPQSVKAIAKPAETAKWVVPFEALDLIKRWESFVGKAYDDRGHLAIGYGHTAKIGLPVVTSDMTMTEPQASALLLGDVTALVGTIMPLIKVRLTPNQLGAVASFTYNLGRSNFASSTLLKKINANDMAGASLEFGKWNKSTNPKTGVKEVLGGLTKRRAAEAALFLRAE
jgi:lysozyme